MYQTWRKASFFVLFCLNCVASKPNVIPWRISCQLVQVIFDASRTNKARKTQSKDDKPFTLLTSNKLVLALSVHVWAKPSCFGRTYLWYLEMRRHYLQALSFSIEGLLIESRCVASSKPLNYLALEHLSSSTHLQQHTSSGTLWSTRGSWNVD